MMLAHEKFQRVIDPGNQVALLLATHWIGLEKIMVTITETEKKSAVKRPSRNPDGEERPEGHGWLKYLNALVDEEHLPYNRWPMWVQEQVDRDKMFFRKTS